MGGLESGFLGQVVVVLHAHDVGDCQRFGHLGGRHVAYANVADKPFAPQISEHSHLLGDGPLLGAVNRPTRQLTISSASKPTLRRLVFETKSWHSEAKTARIWFQKPNLHGQTRQSIARRAAPMFKSYL